MDTETLRIALLAIVWIYVGVFFCTAVITLGGVVSNFSLIQVPKNYLTPLVVILILEIAGGATVIATGTLENAINKLSEEIDSTLTEGPPTPEPTICPPIPEPVCPEMPECPAMLELECPAFTDRTNSSKEEITSSADRTKSSIGQIISAETIKELRQINGVSKLNPLEFGRALTNLPNGRFGFERVRHINNYSSSEFDSTIFDSSVLDSPNFTHRVMEVHKSSIGAIYIVGHLPPSVLVQVQKPNRKDPIDVILFFQPATNLVPVAIPVERIVQSYSRRAKDNEGNSIYVNDMSIR